MGCGKQRCCASVRERAPHGWEGRQAVRGSRPWACWGSRVFSLLIAPFRCIFAAVQSSVVSDSLQHTDCSSPGLPVHHQLPEFTQTHVHRVSDAIQPSHPLSSPSPPAFILPSTRVFSNESALWIRWPKYCSFSISPSNEHSGKRFRLHQREEWQEICGPPLEPPPHDLGHMSQLLCLCFLFRVHWSCRAVVIIG